MKSSGKVEHVIIFEEQISSKKPTAEEGRFLLALCIYSDCKYTHRVWQNTTLNKAIE